MLLWNENGEITEFTNGNIVVEIERRKVTPPIESGLLPGTLREKLLGDGIVEEKVLTRADVENATQIWFINSVRGWVPVHLVSSVHKNMDRSLKEPQRAVDELIHNESCTPDLFSICHLIKHTSYHLGQIIDRVHR